MSSYAFSQEAIQDLDGICEYIAHRDSRAASQFFDTLRQKCKLVANFPNMGKSYEQLSSDLRGFTVDDYLVLYYPNDDGIVIARVVSGYRDLESLFDDLA